MDLDAKLVAAGLDPQESGDPAAVFAALHAAIGEEATVLDRYELEARSRRVAVDEVSRADRDALTIEVLGMRGYEVFGSPSGAQIQVVPYDERWPGWFHWRRGTLRAALGDTALLVEHMGSTAVPGLAAKPTIDILVSVPDIDDEDAYVGAIETVGLTFRSRDETHRYFKPPAHLRRDVQVHVAEPDSAWRRSHLLFRDYLLAHDEVAAAYGELKLRLADDHPVDRMAYTDLKGSFIRRALVEAERWRAANAPD